MAKCPVCNSRKGKRKCLIADSSICSLCCGNTRTAETCANCVFYQKPRRKYSEVPAYTVSEMDGNTEAAAEGMKEKAREFKEQGSELYRRI